VNTLHFPAPAGLRAVPLAPQQIALLVAHESSALDISTATSIFHHANRLAGRVLYQVTLTGPGTEVTVSEGLRLRTVPLEQLTRAIDTIVLAGNPLAGAAEPGLPGLLRQRINLARRWCAIEGGVHALADLGLIRNRWVSLRAGVTATLNRLYPDVQVRDSVYSCDGNLWSCPSGAPVADMCLAMVEHEMGRRLANSVAHCLLMAGRRSGDQPQLSLIMRVQSRGGRDRELAALLDWIHHHLNERLSIPSLASRVSMSERNFHRRFKAFTGFSPGDYIYQVRTEQARQLVFAEVGLKEVADYSGFASSGIAARALRRA
jgi:transcriptional regulator GlxA family with amidase domain